MKKVKEITSKTNKKIVINTNKEILKGSYSNAIKVAVTDSEVILDFALLYSKDEKDQIGTLQNRIIVTPDFASKIAQNIKDTLETYSREKKKK